VSTHNKKGSPTVLRGALPASLQSKESETPPREPPTVAIRALVYSAARSYGQYQIGPAAFRSDAALKRAADGHGHHQGGWNPYFRRARKAMKAPAIAATIAPPATMKAALASVVALIALSTASRDALSISSSR
jgi:hypothetical protein